MISEDSGQTAQMRGLISVFAGRTFLIVGLVVRLLNFVVLCDNWMYS